MRTIPLAQHLVPQLLTGPDLEAFLHSALASPLQTVGIPAYLDSVARGSVLNLNCLEDEAKMALLSPSERIRSARNIGRGLTRPVNPPIIPKQVSPHRYGVFNGL